MIFARGPEDYYDAYSDFVAHYGTPHDGLTPHSGRYPYGSGEDGYQNALNFKGMVIQLRNSGEFENEKDLAESLGMNTSELRKKISISNSEIKQHNITQIIKLREERQMSDSAIAEKLGLSGESQVRSLMKQHEKNKENKTRELADTLKKQVEEKKYLDIGSGVERQLGCTSTKLDTAVSMLEMEGYKKLTFKQPQATNPRQKTTIKVLVKDGTDLKEVRENRDKIESVTGVYLEDDGKTIRNIKPPVSVDPSRVLVRYAEDTDPRGVKGVEKDGTIELKRGVDDISLGNAHYAQVRVDVGGTHYLKGMAVYGSNDEFPPGKDIIFNTNKHRGVPMMGEKDHTVLKNLKDDPANPFGATIKDDSSIILAQHHYIGKDGKEHQSALNIVNEEGDWQKWKKTIASQMLSKQPVGTAKKQLQIAEDRSRLELDEIKSCTNPVVKRKLLEEFASGADEAAVELKAAKFPRQASHVIIPINSLKENQIYAPKYKDGEEVVLVRYPHGGKFEMPRLIVNNRNKEGKEVITPTALDAVGINHKVAEQLSGADFDGDTVLVIPTKGQNIRTSKPLQGLVDFEPKESYAAYDGMPRVGSKGEGFHKQKQMGMVSNLITDMTIKGAPMSDIERAVKHSMVVIDAEKHNLNWRQSEKDFGIDELKRKWQDKGNGKYGGASTLISKASGEARVDEINDMYPKIDKDTGRLVYTKTNRGYDSATKQTVYRLDDGSYGLYKGKDKEGKPIYDPYQPVGKIKMNQSKITNMEATDDATTLISTSNTPMERVYANYANAMKSMANEARKAYISTSVPSADPQARKQYKAEVESLDRKLALAELNAPRERKAQLIASKNIEMAKKANPDRFDTSSSDGKENLKKLRNQCLASARSRTGASKEKVTFTDEEWNAIQHNAISSSKLEKILNNADMDSVRKLATPKDSRALASAKVSRIRSLSSSGYSISEIADDLGISTSTVMKYLNT